MNEPRDVEMTAVEADLQRWVHRSADLPDFLAGLARHTADTFSRMNGEVYCGVTLIRNKRETTVAASGPEAIYMDETQYKCGDGPCLSAARQGQLEYVPDVELEPRWRGYLEEVRHTGIRSILGVPFGLGGRALGGLNIYSDSPYAFTDEMIKLARSYADAANISLDIAVHIGRLAEVKNDLAAALDSRTTINLAVGILMAQNRCGQAEAFDFLSKASANRNIKIRDLAADIVHTLNPTPVETHFKE